MGPANAGCRCLQRCCQCTSTLLLVVAFLLVSAWHAQGLESGYDTEGRTYASIDELWDSIKRRDPDAPAWYERAVKHWDAQSADDNGVLGGYGQLSSLDVRDSEAFLRQTYGAALEQAHAEGRPLVALDCGAGVGRVSELLLLKHFAEVDLVEPSEHLLKKAQERLGGPGPKPFPDGHKAVHFYLKGLEQHHPEPGRYDVIWLQWAALYLTDEDLITFLQRSAAALKSGGRIFVKENSSDSGFVVDREDASITRSDEHYLHLFERAGLRVMHSGVQADFPGDLFTVRMYALAPPSHAEPAQSCSAQ